MKSTCRLFYDCRRFLIVEKNDQKRNDSSVLTRLVCRIEILVPQNELRRLAYLLLRWKVLPVIRVTPKLLFVRKQLSRTNLNLRPSVDGEEQI